MGDSWDSHGRLLGAPPASTGPRKVSRAYGKRVEGSLPEQASFRNTSKRRLVRPASSLRLVAVAGEFVISSPRLRSVVPWSAVLKSFLLPRFLPPNPCPSAHLWFSPACPLLLDSHCRIPAHEPHWGRRRPPAFRSRRAALASQRRTASKRRHAARPFRTANRPAPGGG